MPLRHSRLQLYHAAACRRLRQSFSRRQREIFASISLPDAFYSCRR